MHLDRASVRLCHGDLVAVALKVTRHGASGAAANGLDGGGLCLRGRRTRHCLFSVLVCGAAVGGERRSGRGVRRGRCLRRGCGGYRARGRGAGDASNFSDGDAGSEESGGEYGGCDDLSFHGSHTEGGLLASLGRITGLLAAYFLLIQVLLLARMPFLKVLTGFDRLTLWHRWNGRLTVLLIFMHVTCITVGYALLDRLSPLGETVSSFSGASWLRARGRSLIPSRSRQLPSVAPSTSPSRRSATSARIWQRSGRAPG
jgi:hypothetical protein